MKGVTYHQTIVRWDGGPKKKREQGDEHNETWLKDGGAGLTKVTSVASKNSAICRKYEIRSWEPRIIAVRYEFWIVRLEVE